MSGGERSWAQAPVWVEWLRLTRLQWSGRIAFEREVAHWGAAKVEGQLPAVSGGGGNYRTSVENHVAALGKPDLFYGLILLRSYALMESHCELMHHIQSTGNWGIIERSLTHAETEQVEAIELQGGIEAWSEGLMKAVHQPWTAVFGGKAGLVEVAIVRNFVAHGYSRVSAEMLQYARSRGVSLSFQAGDAVSVEFDRLHEYRGRIRSLCRVLGDGVVHLSRGTHRSA